MNNSDAKANKKKKLIIKISAAAAICIALAVFLTLSFQPQPLFKDKTFEFVDIDMYGVDGLLLINQEEVFNVFENVQTQLTLDDANGGSFLLSEYPILVSVKQVHKLPVYIMMGEKDSYIVVAGLKSYLIGGPELYKKVKEIADKAEIVKEIRTPNYSAKYE